MKKKKKKNPFEIKKKAKSLKVENYYFFSPFPSCRILQNFTHRHLLLTNWKKFLIGKKITFRIIFLKSYEKSSNARLLYHLRRFIF